MSVRPITPDEALEKFADQIPDFVIEAVNELLAKKCRSKTSEIKLLQKEVVDNIMQKGAIPEEEKNSVFDKGYLDFETLYREAGWDVSYDKPGYNESYEAFFVFKRKHA